VRILLVRLRPIGDVVFTTPLLSALRRHYPEAHIAYVVEPDAASFAHAVRQLQGDCALRSRMGRAARAAAVEKYSWAAIAERMEAEYRAVVDVPDRF